MKLIICVVKELSCVNEFKKFCFVWDKNKFCVFLKCFLCKFECVVVDINVEFDLECDYEI